METDERAASSSEMARLETDLLPDLLNFNVLCRLPGMWVAKVHRHAPIGQIVLDMHSSASPTYGEQEGAEYSGHLGEGCYHPLFCFNQFGDVDEAMRLSPSRKSTVSWRMKITCMRSACPPTSCSTGRSRT
jgi:hypothetical protein